MCKHDNPRSEPSSTKQHQSQSRPTVAYSSAEYTSTGSADDDTDRDIYPCNSDVCSGGDADCDAGSNEYVRASFVK